MRPERETLRNQIYKAHSRYVPDHPNLRSSVFKPACPWCMRIIQDPWHAHEVLVKRNAVPEDKQHLIFVPENVLPLHEKCHTEHGQTQLMKLRGLKMLCENLTAESVGLWYASLHSEHELSIPKGILLPREAVTTVLALNYLMEGMQLKGYEPGADTADDELVDLAIHRYKGKKVPAGTEKRNSHGVTFPILYDAIEQGRWYTYLKNTII